MDDIVPKGGRSIRNVSFGRGREEAHVPVKKIQEKVERLERKLEREETHLEKEVSHLEKEESHIDQLRKARAEFEMHHSSSRRGGGKRRKKLWMGGAILGVILLAVLISTVFHGAVVAISPKVVAANVGGDYSAKKTGAVASELEFSTVTLKQMGTETVKASGEETVNQKASGTIVIYNNYNSASQRLIKNTRFETPEGLIFRVSDSVTVPGKSGSTPGSVEATVTADEAGEKYNVGMKDFTIPGFKGDPRYNTFYARSKTPIAGGFSGKRKVVADADRKKAEEGIRAKLRTALLEEVKKTIVDNQIFFDKGFTIDYVSLPEEAVSGSEVLLKVEGTISAAVFNKEMFSKYLAAKTVKGYQGEAVVVKDPQSIFFTPKSDFRPASNGTIAFSLSGTPSFEWLYNEESLKAALVDADREEVVSILQGFPMIEKADISIRPFWRGSFPDSADNISIEKAE